MRLLGSLQALRDREWEWEWRPEPESNRRARICSPLRNHSAIGPEQRISWPLPVRSREKAWAAAAAAVFDEGPSRTLGGGRRCRYDRLVSQLYYWHITPMTVHTPVPDYEAARAAMIDTQLRPQGVNYAPVSQAIASVPREEFVADGVKPLAYTDRAIAIGEGRMMSAPMVLGQLLTELRPRSGERALVVGCGAGYSAAVLEAMGLEVIGLECSAPLAARARAKGLQVVEGPLEEGWAKAAPYDVILIDGAIEFIPDAIVAQLTPQGRLGAALIDQGITRLAVGHRAGEGFGVSTFTDAGAAALPGFTKPKSFSF